MGMNKIYLIITIVTFSLNLFCQQDSVIVLDSTYAYNLHSQTGDWVLDERHIYAYDANGMQTERITSLNGQLLYSDKIEGPTHQIDLSSFQKGLYFITVRSRDYVWTEKIIKL